MSSSASPAGMSPTPGPCRSHPSSRHRLAPGASRALSWSTALGARCLRSFRALREVLNASFAQLPYYTEISPEQMATATESLGWLLDPRLFLIARAHPRRHSPTAATPSPIVAFALVIPDVTSYVQRTRGSMGLMAQLGLLARRSRLRSEAILVIQGTDPRVAGARIDVLDLAATPGKSA